VAVAWLFGSAARGTMLRAQDATLPDRLEEPDVFWVESSALADKGKWQQLKMKEGNTVLHIDAPCPELTLIVQRRRFGAVFRTVAGAPGTVDLQLRYP
jgi:hypothetical protein